MDVEMQMEANGLPTQFSSTLDQPQESHISENLAASLSNSEETVNPHPSKPATESWMQPEPVQEVLELSKVPEAFSEQEPEPAFEAPAEVLPPATNGTTEVTSGPVEDSISAIPDSQPAPVEEIIPIAQAPSVSITETSLSESFVPSSVPAEIPSAATPAETSQPPMDFSEPLPEPPQAPESNLRTAPHSDALTSEAVAEIEAHKHQLDDLADAPATLFKPFVGEESYSTIPPPAEPPVRDYEPPVADIGLPSPPTQSPPPAPQPAPATLPEEKSPETIAPPLPEPIAEPVAESIAEPAAEPFAEPVAEIIAEPVAESIADPLPALLPVEKPKEPAPTPAPAEPQDEDMIDVISYPVKQVREREEDPEDMEPAAKRVKTDDSTPKSDGAEFKVPEVPSAASLSAASPSNANGLTSDDDSVTPARLVHMKKVISNLKKSNASAAFRLPVDYVALNLHTYPDIVKHPMDLQTIDHRLKQNQYTSVSTFIGEFELIVINCIAFNGPDHSVSQSAKKMQSSFNGQMANLPKANTEEPSREIKKAAKKQEPTRSAPPRRPSVTTSAVAAGSPKAAPPTPSFAPGPDGIPLIRRDSSMADGRPKRAIVPTKRNQEFGGGRPKKKKYELQLRFCEEVLKEIMASKHWQLNQYFTHPVDPVALNIPTYFQVIKKPMDLGTVKTKLTNNVYEKAKDFEEDVHLVFKNCYKFNADGDLVFHSGKQLEALFDARWAGKDDWIAAREPQSEPHSEADDDEDEDESEDEAEDSEDERNDKIKLLQKQIEEMSKQMGELTQKKVKKSKSPPTKKSKKSGKKEKAAANFPNLSKDKKEKKKPAPKSKSDKDRYVTFAEKQYISNGIAMLPEKQMQEALKIIQNSVPSLANSDQNEIELDIEEVPNHALLKLLNFVKRYAGPPPDEPKVEPAEVYVPSAHKSKKSKPMSKNQQEAQIEELKGKLGAYAGPVSPNAVQSIETGESSDDDGDSEESEEE